MNRKLIQVAIALAVVGMTTSAHAGIYADDLGRCFVKSTTEDDRLTLIRWMFGSMTLQPALQAMVTVTPEQRDSYAKDVAALYERLLYVDCRQEAVITLRNEGPQSMASGFGVLGTVAVRLMLNNPEVARNSLSPAKFTDKSKMAALYKEAGVPAPASLSAPAP